MSVYISILEIYIYSRIKNKSAKKGYFCYKQIFKTDLYYQNVLHYFSLTCIIMQYVQKKVKCFRWGSNPGPSACEADVITTTLRKHLPRNLDFPYLIMRPLFKTLYSLNEKYGNASLYSQAFTKLPKILSRA